MANNSNNNKNNKPIIKFYLITLGIILLINMFIVPYMAESQYQNVDYGTFLTMLDNKVISKVEINDNNIYFKTNQSYEQLYSTTTFQDPDLVNRLYESGCEFGRVAPKEISPFISMLLSWILPFLIIYLIGKYYQKKMKDSPGGNPFTSSMQFGKSNAKRYVPSESSIKFKDVAGEDEAKDLLSEIVDFLHKPERYTQIGAKIPKGALLVGPPGTGKTMLAKAVAGEANVPFFSISGSEFVEMFVGMGAAKVRDLFKEAAKKAPCIVFIDEIDAIGKKRNSSPQGGNDEREQTLNQLLTEMDGFDTSKGVILLAATNRVETLDSALLRPGRFDRRIPVNLPDLLGREAILKVHAEKIKIASNINFHDIARAASGMSGADLANIINEAALIAVRNNRNKIIQSDLVESIEVVAAGYKKKNKVLTDKEKLIVSYHEVGHALVAALQTNTAPVSKITIIPRTSGALGFTMQIDEEEKNLLSKNELLNKIAIFTGGRAAEEIIFDSITTGASNDIERATKLARSMISRYGMSDEFKMVAFESQGSQYISGDSSLICSENTSSQIDQMVTELVNNQYNKAKELLSNNIKKLHEIAEYLYKKETIDGEKFMEILLMDKKEIS